jgi:RHS repeat-associated protein
VQREYIYLEGEPLTVKEYQTSPGIYHFVNDHLGTPQRLITATGTIVWQAAYFPFGKAQVTTATVQNNLRFPGQYYDAETGLHYNWNRFYDPETRGYISADSIGLDGGMNLYTYVGGNPVNRVDLEGLAWGNIKPLIPCFRGDNVPIAIQDTGHYNAITDR